MGKWDATWVDWLRQREHEREIERLRIAQSLAMPGARERVARAIHDGNAGVHTLYTGTEWHAFADCPLRDQYLADADTVLKELGIQPHDQH